MAGIYLAEYDRKGWLAHDPVCERHSAVGAVSIVIGLFVYAVVVARFKSFSGWAGVLALALIVIPVVIRTTENMLQSGALPACVRRLTPWAPPSGSVITSITLRAARAGVVTGVLLAVARIAGETAPLAVYCPQQPVLDMQTCPSPWPACRSRFSNLR
jgi:phosphate transport system permease protein